MSGVYPVSPQRVHSILTGSVKIMQVADDERWLRCSTMRTKLAVDSRDLGNEMTLQSELGVSKKLRRLEGACRGNQYRRMVLRYAPSSLLVVLPPRLWCL